ncbi:hydantoinase/oxoprolinase family protein [Aquamicrobium defluvii]|uniref:Hydantoin utilization protein n=1 Tax=Aquamicrobium defluvii TaxID=69279 RepID=A0A011U8W1_9HYPH|nr:hydantoinase/oxoprolinase family protein [Aquamicrobium defluvii]EXL02308.1 hydantoin utilization protein [Aquamicrobium defluvii]EZQ13022.1 hydantoin utilization protein [Halopseudomonas bauzanensis]TDR32636.1 N-methylhydantoinase A [Aquamicrobium defluvii]
MTLRIGVDTGGTHTDIVLLDRSACEFHTLKVPTTPDDLSIGILDGVRRIMGENGYADSSADISFYYGTTLITNIIVERKSVRIGLVTTGGFRDVLEIGRAVRKPNIYDIHWRPLPPLVPRELRHGVSERIDYKGNIVAPLNEDDVRSVLRKLLGQNVRAIAICLMNAYANPEHEQRIAAIAAEECPDIPVSLSSDVAREFREYERTSTTALNAFVVAPMTAHLDQLAARLSGQGIEHVPFIMRGNGGVMSFELAKNLPAAVTHSGPVAGIVGGNAIARAAGIENAITFDMGGTSSDVALISQGKPYSTTRGDLAGYPILLPMLDLVTIGAGGGSIAWIDPAGGLKVGPQSAGSVPGPVCYGRGGENPTITDANLVCGRLNADFFLNGERELRLDMARQAIEEKIAGPLGMSVEQAALGILAVAESHMVNAIKLVSVQRGIDPRDFTLMGFGGAGPLHTVSLAGALGIERVLIPAAPGNVSASGLLSAEIRHDLVRTRVAPLTSVDADAMEADFALLVAEAQESLDRQDAHDGQILRALDLRYRGQAYELTLPVPSTALDSALFDKMAEAFHAEHERVYGYRLDHHGIEIVNLRATAIGGLPENPWPASEKREGAAQPVATRPVIFGTSTDAQEWPVYRFVQVAAGQTANGPAIIEYPGSTCIVPAGWTITWDEARHAHIVRNAN